MYYGRYFLNSLPQMPQVKGSSKQVLEYLEQFHCIHEIGVIHSPEFQDYCRGILMTVLSREVVHHHSEACSEMGDAFQSIAMRLSKEQKRLLKYLEEQF